MERVRRKSLSELLAECEAEWGSDVDGALERGFDPGSHTGAAVVIGDLCARLRTVRALHSQDSEWCSACDDSWSGPYPCPTIRALNAGEEEDK